MATMARSLPRTDPARQAYRVLQIAFTVIPIVTGIDQFLNKLADWSMYLAPVATRILPLSAANIMRIGGVVEILAGLLVALRPRIGAWVVAVWLWLIVINLLAAASFYDNVLRDLGLSMGAVALARLAVVYDRATATGGRA